MRGNILCGIEIAEDVVFWNSVLLRDLQTLPIGTGAAAIDRSGKVVILQRYGGKQKRHNAVNITSAVNRQNRLGFTVQPEFELEAEMCASKACKVSKRVFVSRFST